MFCRTVRLENSAPSWNRTPQRSPIMSRSCGLSLSRSWPNTSIVPALLGDEPEDGARQHRLAGARGADEAQNLAAIEVEIEAVHDELIAEAHLEAAHADDGLALAGMFAGLASIVDRREEHREQAVHHDDHEDRLDHRSGYVAAELLGRAVHPHALDRGDDADHHRHERRLDEADHECVRADRVLQARNVDDGRHAAIDQLTSSPPASAAMSARKVRTGSAIDERDQAAA